MYIKFEFFIVFSRNLGDRELTARKSPAVIYEIPLSDEQCFSSVDLYIFDDSFNQVSCARGRFCEDSDVTSCPSECVVGRLVPERR